MTRRRRTATLRSALEMKAALDDRFSSAFLLEALAWAAADGR